MVERICPHCATGNPAEQMYCGQCGTRLALPLARRPNGALARRPIRLPAQWKETGKVVALGVATLAAEAGLAWLQRRQQPVAKSTVPQPPPALPQRRSARVVAMGHRVSETWVDGQLQQRTEEQVMWFAPDDPWR